MRMPRTRKGFTLIELLVVIGVIAILTAIAVPATLNALRSAKKSTAQRQMGDLSGAIKSYFAEYNKMPVLTGNAEDDKAFDAHAALIGILTADDQFLTAADIQKANPKGISFLSLDRAAEQSLLSGGYYTDPWGNAYLVLLDLNFDDRITASVDTGLLQKDIRAKVAVYSKGADGQRNTKDDLKTW